MEADVHLCCVFLFVLSGLFLMRNVVGIT
jgi:hypothetical protein